MGVTPRQIAIGLSGVLSLSICSVVAFCTASAAQAQAAQATVLTAAIPAQPLAEALAAFAHQTGLHVVYVSRIVRSQNSHEVPAGLSADDALAQLLQGTRLRFEFLTPRTIRILAAVPPAAAELPHIPDGPQPLLNAVIVTGSRIPVPESIAATSPVRILTAEDIALGGYVDTMEVIAALPQMTITGSDVGNFSAGNTAAGFATADLRGLGPHRTVILVNGRRLGIADAHTSNLAPAPDLDQIPLAMVDRIEVLSGGASATYGSDAIAGVVNFILKDHVQGVQIEGQYGFAQHAQKNGYIQGREEAAGVSPPNGTTVDAFTREVSVLAGTGFQEGIGQITGYFIYHSQKPVFGSARDFSACSAISTNQLSGVPTQSGFTCFGSLDSNRFTINARSYSVVGNQFVPWPAAGSVPPALFNPDPYESIQREDTRYQAGLLVHLDLNEAVKPYFEFSFMCDHTLNYAAPSGLFLSQNGLTSDGRYRVNCSNPLLSNQEASFLCTPDQIAADKADPGSASADVDIGWRNIEGASRLANFEHRNYRVVGSVGGKLGDAFSYDAYALYYYTSLFQANEYYVSYASANKALQVTTDSSGRPVCISAGICVPYNLFTTGAVSAQQLAYLYTQGTDGGHNSEQIAEADVTGQLDRYGLISPWARAAVAFNAGAEHRTETLRFAPDTTELSGELAGYSGAAVAIDKRVSVDEGFVEIRVPIAQNQPIARELTIETGYRYSRYSTAGTTNTYKFDLQFAPLADLELGVSYNRVVRAPNLIELYTPLSYGYPSVAADPCAPTNGGATHAAATLTECQHTGVTAAQYGDGFGPAFGGTSSIAQCSGTCGVVVGGDPALAPETADSWLLRAAFNPVAVPTLTGSVDYFHILVRDEIAIVPEAVTLQQCLATGDPTWCSQIVRSSTGALSGATATGGGYIFGNLVNTGAASVSGIDVEANYRQQLVGRWGTLTVSLSGTWLQHNSLTPYRSAPAYDCAGLFGATCFNGSVNPTWRHNLRVTWRAPWKMQLSAQWRFIGRTGFDNNSSQPALQNQEEGFFDPELTHVPSTSYLDLSALWAPTSHMQIRVAVNNVLDTDPPFIPSIDISGAAVTLNTFPIYDLLGRRVLMALRATF